MNTTGVSSRFENPDQPQLSWWEENQRMKPQSNAVAAGMLVLLCTGAHFAWGLVDMRTLELIFNITTTSPLPTALIILTLISFFLAAIVGFILAGFLYGKTTTKNIYWAATGLTGVSGILFIAFSRVFAAILIGRIFAGFAHGLAYVTVIVHASEIATPKARGRLIGSAHYCFITGMFVYAAFTLNNIYFVSNSDGFLNGNTWMGILTTIMAALNIVIILVFSRESPIFYLRKHQEGEALTTMARLRSEIQETWSIRNEFNELKAMLTEEEGTTSNIWRDGNQRPLFQVLLMKIAFCLSFNMITSQMRTITYVVFFTLEMNYAYLALFGIQLVSLSVAVACIDIFGRRKFFLISAGVSGALLVIFGIAFYLVNYSDIWMLYALVGIAIAYEVSLGLGLGLVSDVYGGEAFSSIKKSKSLALVSTVEYLLQVIFIIIFMTVFLKTTALAFFIIFLIFGLLMVIITTYLASQLPETAKMSIRQSKNEFLKNNFKFFGQPSGITYS